MPDYPGTVRDRYTRITLFKAPEPVQQAALKDAYTKLVHDAKKVCTSSDCLITTAKTEMTDIWIRTTLPRLSQNAEI
jgi:hypothetical protein